jgi:hypothetical protein
VVVARATAQKWETGLLVHCSRGHWGTTNEINQTSITNILRYFSYQAIAAVGQGRLMAIYDDLFGQFNQAVAQILLTRNDLADVSETHSCFNFRFDRIHSQSILYH